MTRPELTALPAEPGVYRFRDQAGKVLYIGRAVALRRRVSSYWGDLRDRPRLRPMVRQISRIEAVVCASEHEASWLERNLLERAKPRWNRMIGGLESPVYVELSPDRLRTSFSDVHFGPYLSGTRARAAVAALNRLYPLSYTSARLTDSERDMARKRGVSPADRDRLHQAISSVLQRDPAAVSLALHQLTELRDTASADLAFERAAILQEELEALRWLTSTQRVTSPARHDTVFHGWSDGTLVRFEIKAGRLSSWRVTDATARTAAAHVAATPPEWTDFATLNASLASALRTP